MGTDGDSTHQGNGVPGKHPYKGRTTAFDLFLTHKLLALAGDPPISIVLWNGTEIPCRAGRPVGSLIIHDRGALIKLLVNPDLCFGDLYSSGRVSVEGDLPQFLEAVYYALEFAQSRARAFKLLRCWQCRPRSNTLSGSAANIHHHYDIGNDFYRLWLDRDTMQYTCAYFADPDMTLEQAQLAKIHHVCRKLQLKPGETVVEAGCGWGAQALIMAKEYGVKVRAYNISHEQIRYAREKLKTENLQDQVEYIEDDYRNITGEYDVFLSVGMLEHVGRDHYHNLGSVINQVLKPRGRGLIHNIGQNTSQPFNPWIEKRIFPGAYPPTLKEMMAIFEPWSFSILDVENLRLHYARTLEHWLARFEEHIDQIREMFDEEFIRSWRLYLAGSIPAFSTGSLQLFQVVFARPQKNDIPWTRAHLYLPMN